MPRLHSLTADSRAALKLWPPMLLLWSASAQQLFRICIYLGIGVTTIFHLAPATSIRGLAVQKMEYTALRPRGTCLLACRLVPGHPPLSLQSRRCCPTSDKQPCSPHPPRPALPTTSQTGQPPLSWSHASQAHTVVSPSRLLWLAWHPVCWRGLHPPPQCGVRLGSRRQDLSPEADLLLLQVQSHPQVHLFDQSGDNFFLLFPTCWGSSNRQICSPAGPLFFKRAGQWNWQ